MKIVQQILKSRYAEKTSIFKMMDPVTEKIFNTFTRVWMFTIFNLKKEEYSLLDV